MNEQALFDWLDPLIAYLPSLQDYRWQLAVLLVTLGSLLVALIIDRILCQLVSTLARTSPVWDDLLIDALRRPLILLILMLALTLSLQLSAPHLQMVEGELPKRVREVGFILLLSWALIRFVVRAEEAVLRRDTSIDRTTADAICKLVKLIIVVLTGLVLMQYLGYSISGILAFGGIGGLAVGFAAKDLLANFFGGLMIYLDRPFKVGDWVRSPDKQIEGVVEKIGWRLTVIRTFDKRPLYIPNATFASISVENPSRMTNRRIYEYVGVRYDDAGVVKQVVDRIRDMLVAHPEIDENSTLFTQLNRFGPSSLDIMIYCFTHTTDWGRYLEIREDVMLRIIDIVDELGAEIAFPTTTVHLQGQVPGLVESA
ncbi:mechanosensitive ion channel protein MscS [Marinobacterium zhoushanense]|uniref:Mechanosensitive ion channel protein MscS n=1 Tax=Marinobacterium zhoushanense TaxID=1679163 RepID=A0ABQ1KMX8_9GAMM|nr:mechanosensitive ion channel family protein [Marinobacterium zhoushanense]GGC02791.1 mechanosensitive ion channel protein MscS [Marinobacterium zhoushanense]